MSRVMPIACLFILPILSGCNGVSKIGEAPLPSPSAPSAQLRLWVMGDCCRVNHVDRHAFGELLLEKRPTLKRKAFSAFLGFSVIAQYVDEYPFAKKAHIGGWWCSPLVKVEFYQETGIVYWLVFRLFPPIPLESIVTHDSLWSS